jgi:3-dehydroquinate dehydratase I
LSQKPFSLCVSVSGFTVESLGARIREARDYEPSLIELRLDFIRNLDTKKLEMLRGLLEGNEILTIRSRGEGGMLSIPEEFRIELIRYSISRLNPFLVDIEISTLRQHPSLLQELHASATKLIASYHDFNGTKSAALLEKVISTCPDASKFLYATKIACQANAIQDNLEVLNLYSKQHPKLVAFCMGPLGIPSRILSLFLGSPYSYASLPGNSLAPGQLDIDIMRKIL